MALGTVTLVEEGVMGDLKYGILTVVPTSGANYTANGEAFDVMDYLGTFVVEPFFAVATPADEASGASYLVVNLADSLLVAFDAATGVEEAANQNLSTMTFTVFVLGR